MIDRDEGILCRQMKNTSVSVGGVNVAFNDDGTMQYIAMKVVNMDEEHRWQEVVQFQFTLGLNLASSSKPTTL